MESKYSVFNTFKRPYIWALVFLLNCCDSGKQYSLSSIEEFDFSAIQNITYIVEMKYYDNKRDTLVYSGKVFAEFDELKKISNVRLNTFRDFDIIHTEYEYFMINHLTREIIKDTNAGFNFNDYSIIGNKAGNLTAPLMYYSVDNPILNLSEQGFQMHQVIEGDLIYIEIISPANSDVSGKLKFWINDSSGFFHKIEEDISFEGKRSYTLFEFDSVQVNVPIDKTIFSIDSYEYKKSIYIPEKPNLNLQIGENASWLISYIKNGLNEENEDVEIEHVFVLDFWYAACMPCRNAMKDLEELHQKYKNDNVHFIGMNPIDQKESASVSDLLFKIGVTYPSLYDLDKQVFDCKSYPTVFVVKDQKIVFKEVGYDNNFKTTVSGIIDAALGY